MHQLKRSIRFFFSISLLIAITVSLAFSQSGRGRPRVPQPATPATATPPPPVSVPAAATVTKQEQAGTASRFVLRNGITVLISEHHSTRIAAAVAYFRAGSRDESGTKGVARLVAHLMFKGTALRPGDRGISDLRKLGAFIKATPGRDGTTYSLVAPPDKLRDALAIQADMLASPLLDAEAARREAQAVLVEEKTAIPEGIRSGAAGAAIAKLDGVDDAAAYSMARVFGLAFASGEDVSSGALAELPREKLVEFYRRHYRPENLIIAVAGDVSTFSTLVDIQQLFGELGATPALPADPANKVTAPEQSKLRYAAERSDVTQSNVSIGFRVPGSESKDWPAVEMLAAMIGQGRASRLSRSLVDAQLAASRVESHAAELTGASLLTISMTPATPASIDKAESGLFKELDRLRRELPTESEMARARAVLEKRLVGERETYLGRATALARAEVAGLGLRGALDYRARTRAVRAEDVQRAAAKYLTLANTIVHEYEPSSAPQRTFDSDTFATTVSTWAPGFAEPVADAAARPADAGQSVALAAQGLERTPERQALIEQVEPFAIKDFSTLNGARAFVREDHSQPQVTIALLFQGGRLVEDASNSGTTELMLRSILGGTPRRTLSQMNEEMDGLGADVRIVVEPDFFGFTMSVLTRNADRALKLLREAVEEPAFRDEDVARARLGQIAAIRAARDSGWVRSRELAEQGLLPGHAYALPPHGIEEVVQAVNKEKLTEWHVRATKRQLPVAIIVGDTDGSALVSSQIAEGFKRRELDTAIQVKTPQPVPAAEKVEQRRRGYTTVAAALRGPKVDTLDLSGLQIIESAMNGPGGRLDAASKAGASTNASLDSEAMFVAGVMVARVETAPSNEQAARAALFGELDRLRRGGLTADELASARALAATARAMLLQSQSQHALEYAQSVLYQKKAADVDDFSEQFAKVTADDIKRIASTYFKSSTASTGIVRGTAEPSRQPPAKQN